MNVPTQTLISIRRFWETFCTERLPCLQRAMTLSLAEKQVVTSRCIQPDDSLHLTGVEFE